MAEACSHQVACFVHTPASLASTVLARFCVSRSTRCVRDPTDTLHSRYSHSKTKSKESSCELDPVQPSADVQAPASRSRQEAQPTAAAPGAATSPVDSAPSPTLARPLAHASLSAHVITDPSPGLHSWSGLPARKPSFAFSGVTASFVSLLLFCVPLKEVH